MIRYEISTTIDRPVEEVFDYLSDFLHLPEYEPVVEEVRLTSPEPIGLGSTWWHVRRQGRRRIEAPIEIVEFEPNRKLAIRSGGGPFRVWGAQVFERAGDGTRVTETLEMTLTGLLRLMEPLMRGQARRQGLRIHRRMKEVIEGLPRGQE